MLLRQLDYQGHPAGAYGRVINDFSGKPVGILELLIDRSAAVAAHQHTLLYILGTGGCC
ncbi:hypothetical protein [Chromatium okenii]|uniref:hypothetical protein n=1 Tax=Chromatium okenii TaxID=61644 RepID=UPI003221EE41